MPEILPSHELVASSEHVHTILNEPIKHARRAVFFKDPHFSSDILRDKEGCALFLQAQKETLVSLRLLFSPDARSKQGHYLLAETFPSGGTQLLADRMELFKQAAQLWEKYVEPVPLEEISANYERNLTNMPQKTVEGIYALSLAPHIFAGELLHRHPDYASRMLKGHKKIPGEISPVNATRKAMEVLATQNDFPADDVILDLVRRARALRAKNHRERHERVRGEADRVQSRETIAIVYGGGHFGDESDHPLEIYFEDFDRTIVEPRAYAPLAENITKLHQENDQMLAMKQRIELIRETRKRLENR